jgi:hypothetical protein
LKLTYRTFKNLKSLKMMKNIINQSVKSVSLVRAIAVVVTFSLFLLPVKMSGQGSKANFSGTWAFNETKSNLGEGGFRGASKLVITQDGNNLTVARDRTNQNGENVTTTDKYTLDGKECVNTSGRGPSKSFVTWSADGKNLNFAVTRTFERDGQTTEMKSSEVWTLTDASTLSLVSTMNFQGEERKTTFVYDKK